ncbi:unnamed protein product, partial [Discosporangium mesarthrocarpum]
MHGGRYPPRPFPTLRGRSQVLPHGHGHGEAWRLGFKVGIGSRFFALTPSEHPSDLRVRVLATIRITLKPCMHQPVPDRGKKKKTLRNFCPTLPHPHTPNTPLTRVHTTGLLSCVPSPG